MAIHLFLFLAAAGIGLAAMQDAAPAAPAVEPLLEKLDETRSRLGHITLDRKSREIRFPAKVNMAEGLLEFLVVHANGKLHESLLVTEVSPTKLNLAFTLLRYPPSRELYFDVNAANGPVPEVPAEVKAAARIAIEVEWKDGERLRRIPANEWIQHSVKATSMTAGPWVYGGSEIEDGKYAPEATGDIIAIFNTNSAIVNYPGKDRADDEVWTSFPKRVPPPGTDVTLIITPFSPKP